jgi:hypothetical protein
VTRKSYDRKKRAASAAQRSDAGPWYFSTEHTPGTDKAERVLAVRPAKPPSAKRTREQLELFPGLFRLGSGQR